MYKVLQLLTRERCLNNPEVRETLDSHAVGVTIGNFDGMHRGHQCLFGSLFSLLEPEDKPFKILLTLAPHPRRKLSGVSRDTALADKSFWSITPSRQKILLAQRFGFDAVMLLRFTKEIQSFSPAQFVDEIICKALSASVVVVGDDWRFGKNRLGNSKLLAELCAKAGVKTKIVSEVKLGQDRISSSRVRAALAAGDLAQLSKLLSRRFSVASRVVHGQKLGRELGYPTANLRFQSQLLPPDGVYAGFAHIGETILPAAISLGNKPMFDEMNERLLEVYLLDTDWIDLYGQWIEVEFVEFIRKQQRFENIDTLKSQIAQDVDLIRKHLSTVESNL